MGNRFEKNSIPRVVWVVVFLIVGVLSLLTFKINCLPDDSCISYIPTAAKIFDLRYPSEMHNVVPDSLSHLNMRSKEAFVFGIALLQRLCQDTASSFPNIFLVILAVGGDAALFYYIFARLFNRPTGLFAFVLWTTTFWPYQYALLGAHQPVVLFFFLATVYLLLIAEGRWMFYGLAGVTGGLMLFSSPTAPLYFPYFFVLFLSKPAAASRRAITKNVVFNILLFILGAGLVILFFVLPDPGDGARLFIHYLLTSQGANHFRHYYAYLSQIFPLDFTFRGAGWRWVGQYFFLIMPILFPAYGLSLLYLLVRSFQKRRFIAIILVSLSTPLLAETAQVAQFGRNYFSWLPAMIFVMAYVFYEEHKRWREHSVSSGYRRLTGVVVGMFFLGQILFNVMVFSTEIFPARMGTTRVREWLDHHQVKEVLVYAHHPRNPSTVDVLNNPKFGAPIKFYGISRLSQADHGYVLVPPARGMTIFNNCVDGAFLDDIVLNKLFETGEIDKYAVFSAPTLATSRIWSQEEEVCAYRDLILNQVNGYDEPASRFYIVDIGKLRQDGWLSGIAPRLFQK